MNRHYKIMVTAVLTVLMMVSISQSGTIAQGLDTPDDEPPVVLAPNDTAALVSSSFTYQGLLKNGGSPVNNQCDFIWNVFADSSGGTSLATDTDTAVQVTNGLFTAAINLPAAVIDGNARFVEIQVRCPTGTGVYTLLSPRQELQAAPYALGLRLPFSHSINDSVSPLFAITIPAETPARLPSLERARAATVCKDLAPEGPALTTVSLARPTAPLSVRLVSKVSARMPRRADISPALPVTASTAVPARRPILVDILRTRSQPLQAGRCMPMATPSKPLPAMALSRPVRTWTAGTRARSSFDISTM